MAITVINIAIQRLQQCGQCTGDEAPHRHHNSSACDASCLAVNDGATGTSPAEEEFLVDHQFAAIQQNIQPGLRHMTAGMLGIKHRSEVCVSILFRSVILGVQGPSLGDTVLLHYQDAMVLQGSGDAEGLSAGQACLGAEVRSNQCRKG